ncbi:GAF and ANTAR domain-containing protein [Cellulomonas sp. URHE0023]|uniref:GAF and ANTAR domain-containing protein n=1 Tax=Cellulomonas sp. URHE0023 TaxID=1380354 RepID=UPI0006902588|nr:GAF and ANTAR domain-containing protein [Cellulomonas sp. URHE0023]
MTTRSSTQALADVAASLVQEHDTTTILAQLVQDAAEFVPADAGAFLVRLPGGAFDLLSSTSHKVSALELFQVQTEVGPCVDACNTGQATHGIGRDDILGRWPDVGQAILDAGFLAVHAFPMVWRGRALGGLNLFSVEAAELSATSAALAQNFADYATLAILQPEVVAEEVLAERMSAALDGRVVIEQAKGVLAFQQGLDMGSAYEELVRLSRTRRATLAQVASDVLRAAQTR